MNGKLKKEFEDRPNKRLDSLVTLLLQTILPRYWLNYMDNQTKSAVHQQQVGQWMGGCSCSFLSCLLLTAHHHTSISKTNASSSSLLQRRETPLPPGFLCRPSPTVESMQQRLQDSVHVDMTNIASTGQVLISKSISSQLADLNDAVFDGHLPEGECKHNL